MSRNALRSLFGEEAGPENGQRDAPAADIVVEEDDDLAGAIETWFEQGDEFDRRYGGVDGSAG